MQENEFKAWLKAQGITDKAISSRMSWGRRLERQFQQFYDGGLDEAFDTDQFEFMRERLKAYRSEPEDYSEEIAALFSGGGDVAGGLPSFLNVLSKYADFRASPTTVTGRLAGLDREAILAAIEACDAAGSPQAFVADLDDRGLPNKFWLLHDGRRYPSKAIVHWAMRDRGIEANAGGSLCKATLEELGFVVVDWPELQRARDSFLRQMPGFTSFREMQGEYWEVERRYKNQLIEDARAISGSGDDDRAAGEAIYRILVGGQQGVPLNWRTLPEVQQADPALSDRFYLALGELARSEVPGEEAIATAARELEALRDAGIAGLRRGEVLSIPITIWATLHPEEASWFKIAKIEEMGKRLFGRKLFPQNEFRVTDLAEWLQLMRALFGLLDKEFGWEPQDLFDVQGFVWVALGGNEGAKALPDDTQVWLVTSLWGDEDGTDRFVERGEWSLLNDTDSANNRRVREMQVGDRIFLKDFIPRATDLPFDAGGGVVTANRIRAAGTITEASTDGLRVGVDWERLDPPRTWYFYTSNHAVWRLKLPSEEHPSADRLRAFLLEAAEQGYAWFLNNPFWRDRLFGAPANNGDPQMTPTNLILYGPPGTGKTYRTAEEAVRLCEGEIPEERDELMARYDALSKDGRIRFVTFHQNFSYEEFVEGLRPETAASEGDEAGSGGFRLEPRPGIFRELSAIAEEARKRRSVSQEAFDFSGRKFWKMSLGQIGSEDSVYEASIAGEHVALGWGGDVDWSSPEYTTQDAIREKWNSEPREDDRPSNVTQLHPFRNTMKKGDIVVVPYGNKAFRAIGEILGDYYFERDGEPTYYHRRKVRWLAVPDEPLPLDTIVDGDFQMRSFYSIASSRVNTDALGRLIGSGSEDASQQAESGEVQQFVLIIDEINRANISKVFGELITLIEPDKRLGMKNALKVRLPYSKREFGVPANLHIIGTMNTADRSIALLDTALRRRFRFEEIAPEPKLLHEQVGNVPLRRVLEVMNERIEYLHDREHRIGHAFFMGEGGGSREALDATMRDKVIPLLQEYFFDDWSRIAAVVGEGFVEKRKLPVPPGIEAGEDRWSWSVREKFADDAYETLIGNVDSQPQSAGSGE